MGLALAVRREAKPLFGTTFAVFVFRLVRVPMKFSLLAISAVSVLLTFSLQTQAQSQGQGAKIQDKAYTISSEDAEMEEAIGKARTTLDSFLKIRANPPRGAEDFKIKVKFTDGDNTEHIWVTPFQVTKAGFTGTLAGEPDYVADLENGQEVTFTRADISDWGYVLNGKQKGSYTVCVMFKHMPAADANRYRRDHGFEC
ncbi:MAG: YegJ family protein [Giesbergeria sp.]